MFKKGVKVVNFLFVVSLFAFCFNQKEIYATTFVSDGNFFTAPEKDPSKLNSSDYEAMEKNNSSYYGTCKLTPTGEKANSALGSDVGVWEQFLYKNGLNEASNAQINNSLDQVQQMRNDISNIANSAKSEYSISGGSGTKTQYAGNGVFKLTSSTGRVVNIKIDSDSAAKLDKMIKEFESKFGIPFDFNNKTLSEINLLQTEDGTLIKTTQPSYRNFKFLDRVEFTITRLDGRASYSVLPADTLNYFTKNNGGIMSKYRSIGGSPQISQSGNKTIINFGNNLNGKYDLTRDKWTGSQNGVSPACVIKVAPNAKGMYNVVAKVYATNYVEQSNFYVFSTKVYSDPKRSDDLCKWCHPAPANARKNTKTVDLKKKPSDSSDILVHNIGKNAKFTYLGKSGKYSKVKFGSRTGYVLTSSLKVDTTPTGKCEYREDGKYSSVMRGGISYENGSAQDFYKTHKDVKYSSIFYESAGYNGQTIRSKTTRNLGYLEYTLEYWPYKEDWKKIHNISAEKSAGIKSTNGYAELYDKKINKAPDKVQRSLLVSSYEWQIGVVEPVTPIPGAASQNAQIGSSLTK